MISTAFAAAEKAGAGLPQFETSNFPSQIFWAIISFGILLLLFRKYILPPIHHILDERVSRIRGDMEEAEKMKQQAEQVLVDYHAVLAVLAFLGLAAPWYLYWVPLGFTVVFMALEVFIAFIQAYIFTILTCVYLDDALEGQG